MAVSDWNTNPNNNTTVGGVFIGEGCPSANVNNGIRSVMAEAKTKFNSIDNQFASNAPTGSTQAIAALNASANKLPYFTGSTTAALTDLSPFMRTLLDDASAAAARSTLGAIGISAQSLTANGYVRLTNGLTLQWGSFSQSDDTLITVTFPIAFSTACFSCICAGATEVGNGNAQANGSLVSSFNVNGFTSWRAAPGTGPAWFMALGV